MASDQFIEPFPSDIDRDAFGHWLSGFTDGEGCFFLGLNSQKRSVRCPKASFTLALRADDRDVLRLSRSYLNCGILLGPYRTACGRPSYRLDIRKVQDLASVIVPHFTAYPLRSKKKRDFEIWSQAVRLMEEVGRITYHKISGKHYSRRWDSEKLTRFAAYRDALRVIRQFDSVPEELPLTTPLRPSQPSLFD